MSPIQAVRTYPRKTVLVTAFLAGVLALDFAIVDGATVEHIRIVALGIGLGIPLTGALEGIHQVAVRSLHWVQDWRRRSNAG